MAFMTGSTSTTISRRHPADPVYLLTELIDVEPHPGFVHVPRELLIEDEDAGVADVEVARHAAQLRHVQLPRALCKERGNASNIEIQ